MASMKPTPWRMVMWSFWRIVEGGLPCRVRWCGRRQYAFMRYCQKHGIAIVNGPTPAKAWR